MTEWVLSSCLLIAVVLLLRAALGKRISAVLRYSLWAVVLVRLLVPMSFFTLPGAVPQIPAWTPPESMQAESIFILPVGSSPLEESGVRVMEDGHLGDPHSFGYPKLTHNGETVVRYADRISPLELLGWIWAAGAAVMGIILTAANFRFSIRLRRVRKPLTGTAAPIPVYVAAGVPSPCLLGLLRPAVYVTGETAANPAMLRHVLAHELTHYNHRDHLWSVLRGAALAVHWWNPLVWLAVVYSRRDGELACDEGALKMLGDSERAAYGETLLTLVTAKSRPGDLLCFATTMTGGKRSLKERIQRIARQPKRLVSAMVAVIAVLSLSVLVAFGQGKDPAGEEPPVDTPSDGADTEILDESEISLQVEADLLHNGEPGTLTLWCFQERGTERLDLRFSPAQGSAASGGFVVDDQVTMEHEGWKAYFLCHLDGEDYLLRYTPYNAIDPEYSYQLFYLAPDGGEVVVQEGSVFFDISEDAAGHYVYDPAELAAFMEEVNALLAVSEELVTTNPNLQASFYEEGRLYDHLHWLDRTRDDSLSMLENLQNRADYAEDHPDDIWSSLADLLENLTASDIGDISAQDAVTAGDLVALIQEVSLRRTSRYHTYSSFEAEEVWTWSMGEWAVPLTNGGTLHLIACDSGSIEISYETETEAVSAFYRRESTLHSVILRAGTLYSKVLPYEVDLDRDGIFDEMVMQSVSDDGTAWSLQCNLSSGGTWETEANTAHAGWNAVFLCQMDGEDYLLQYVPYFGQMQGEYHYKLFYLAQNTAREVVVQENSLDFQIGPTAKSTGADPIFGDTSPKEIAAFMEEINALLSNSVQVLNTDQYLQSVFANEGRLYDSMIFLQETWEPDKTLLENLLIYRNQILADSAVNEAIRIDRITEEDIISATLEDGTPVSKPAVAELLQSDRTTRYNMKEAEWEPRYQAITVTYTSPGDTGEQTLTLQAGVLNDLYYVRITLEGQKTALQYSENPDNDATYLRDVPYSLEGYIYTSEFYDGVTALSRVIEQSILLLCNFGRRDLEGGGVVRRGGRASPHSPPF